MAVRKFEPGEGPASQNSSGSSSSGGSSKVDTSKVKPGDVVGGPNRTLPNGGAVVDGRYIPPGLNLSGLGGGSSQSKSCPPGYHWDESRKACVKDDAKIWGDVSADTPVGEVAPPAETTTDAYLKFLQEQQAAAAKQARQEARESARDIVGNLLQQYGLGSLTDFVNDLIFKEDIVSEAMLIAKIRETNQYKERFKGMALRRQRGLNMPSEAEYIGLENTYRQLMRSAGMPTNLFDQPDDLATLIGYDVSPAELNARINDGYRAVADSNPEVINQLRRLYGFKEGELAAYFLNPERTLPALTRQARSAQIAGQAQLQAGQEITATQAEELAMAGVTQQQAQAGFQTIAGAQELFGPLAGTTETGITQGEQIAGIFGTSAAAQQRIRQRARERTSVFEQGGKFAGQGTTVTGLQ